LPIEDGIYQSIARLATNVSSKTEYQRRKLRRRKHWAREKKKSQQVFHKRAFLTT